MDVPLCIILHHGGRWENIPEFTYVGGNIKLINDIPNDFDANNLKAIIASLGYNDVIRLHYCDPLKTLGDGIRFLGFEEPILTQFVSLLHECKMIDIFNEHEYTGYDVSTGGLPNAMEDCVADDHEIMPTTVNKELSSTAIDATVVIEDVDFDEEESDNEDDELKEARYLFKAEKKASEEYANEEESLHRIAERKGKTLTEDYDDYEDDSSDVDSPSESENEDCGYLLPTFSDNKREARKTSKTRTFLLERNQKQCPFFLGQQFEDAKEFRTAVANYSVSIGRDLHYTTNKSKRLGLRCKEPNCPFYIWISEDSGKKPFFLKL
ncbi:RNA-binding protein rnp-1 [Bienertia sinuspersici]